MTTQSQINRNNLHSSIARLNCYSHCPAYNSYVKLFFRYQLQVVGSRAMLSGLKVMLEMMELAAECRKTDPAALALYQPHIARFKETIQTLEHARNTTQ